jgi:hypothetical protein
MNALSAAQKQKNYRTRKEAGEFIERTGLSSCPTVEEFLSAQVQDESPLATVDVNNINASALNRFYEILEDYDNDMASEYLDPDELDEDYKVYSVVNMLDAWNRTAKEVA